MKSTLSALSLILLLGACGPLADARSARIEARNPPQGQMLTVGSATIHAEVSGHGPDLVLIHGASGSTGDMADLARRLSDRYRVIRFDRPGLGYSSDLGRAGNSPLVQADYLIAASRQLGVTDPIVLGHSYGGAVAMAWALRDPGHTRAVVLLAGAVLPWEGGLDGLSRFASTPVGEATVEPMVAAFMPDWGLKRIVKNLFEPNTPPPGYAADTGAELALRLPELRANLRQLNALKDHLWIMAPNYYKLHMPIEIVHGLDDDVVDYTVESLQMTALPNVRLTAAPGVGHMVHHVIPDEVVAAIDRAAARAD
ncbi:alpha/beta fold hydrolase [Falsirhodobacter algicola]|uniref:Alpha/beta fold hydrolase n=1 Tax=Falsirhodobacter algicola TaxID=2692330 RepID=A0A8J8SK39_9RHOB|nr:alpha/beta hydrolase [Falsirhodobacter algicola]QUS35068.1 alpha/beta fold hydrolase [Falsirhodobacter algicola]